MPRGAGYAACVSTQVRAPELFGVTESSFTLSWSVEDASGPVDAAASVLVNGEERARSEGPRGTRLVRIEGLEPKTRYEVDIRVAAVPPVEHDAFFPGHVETLPGTDAALVGSFATLNDLHFGEPRFGGRFQAGETVDVSDEPVAREGDTEIPYWRFMNDDAVTEINATHADFVVIKGDIADTGRRAQFEAAAQTFAGFRMPHHAFLGNHDHYGLLAGEQVDGYALLDQPPAPTSFDHAGWRMVLLDTTEPGEHHGVFGDERMAWLEDALAETRETDMPTLVFMHHQPCPPEFRDRFPNNISILPEHSLRLFDLIGRNPQVKAVLIGHTHQNRVRRYPASGATPFVEVQCVKDYPGGFAYYRLYDDGHFRQEVRRTSTERALAHSTRCRDFFRGGYRRFALGGLEARCFVAGGSASVKDR